MRNKESAGLEVGGVTGGGVLDEAGEVVAREIEKGWGGSWRRVMFGCGWPWDEAGDFGAKGRSCLRLCFVSFRCVALRSVSYRTVS